MNKIYTVVTRSDFQVAIRSIEHIEERQDIEPSFKFVEKEVLEDLREKVGRAVVKWIKAIAKNSQDALQNYNRRVAFLQKNIWYPDDLLIACRRAGEDKMYKWIKKDFKQQIGHLPSKFFDKIPANTSIKLKYRKWEFIAKSAVIPSEALAAAFDGLSIMDCGMACQMSRYFALQDIIGEHKFNRLFGKEVGQPINIGLGDDMFQPMRYLTVYRQSINSIELGEPGNRPVKVGSLVGFIGVSTYLDKCPYGHWGSLNTFCIDDTPQQQKFVALGISPEGNTEAEIDCLLLEQNNQINEHQDILLPDDDEMVKIKIALRSSMPDAYGKFEVERNEKFIATKVNGYHPGSPSDFIIEIIKDLVALPLEKVSIDFLKNHPRNAGRFQD